MARNLPKKKAIDISELESTMNDALEASTMVHAYLEDLLTGFAMLNTGFASEANTGMYAIKHLRDTVTAAHEHFYAVLERELANRRNAA